MNTLSSFLAPLPSTCQLKANSLSPTLIKDPVKTGIEITWREAKAGTVDIRHARVGSEDTMLVTEENSTVQTGFLVPQGPASELFIGDSPALANCRLAAHPVSSHGDPETDHFLRSRTSAPIRLQCFVVFFGETPRPA